MPSVIQGWFYLINYYHHYSVREVLSFMWQRWHLSLASFLWIAQDHKTNWRQEEKGTTEDEMVMASLNQCTWVWASFGNWSWTGELGVCSPWGHKESDTTERLNWTGLMGFPSGSMVKNPPAMQKIQKPRFDPWVRKIPWKRKWQPTPVFFPGESHGQRSLTGFNET